MNKPRFSTFDLTLLLLNIFALGALLVLLVLNGPSGPVILLMIGAAGMAIGKLGYAFKQSRDAA